VLFLVGQLPLERLVLRGQFRLNLLRIGCQAALLLLKLCRKIIDGAGLQSEHLVELLHVELQVFGFLLGELNRRSRCEVVVLVVSLSTQSSLALRSASGGSALGCLLAGGLLRVYVVLQYFKVLLRVNWTDA
jgi:hypothetical protein